MVYLGRMESLGILVKMANQVMLALRDSLGPRGSLGRKERRVIQALAHKVPLAHLDPLGYQDSVLSWTS